MNEQRPEWIGGQEGQEPGRGQWEARVAELARGLPYPPTPQLAVRSARAIPARRPLGLRPAVALALMVAVLALALAATPGVRAAIVRVFQLGVVRIFVTEPATATPEPGGTLGPAAEPATGKLGATAPQVPVTATPEVPRPPTALPGVTFGTPEPAPTAEPGLPAALSGLAGRTTLEEAQKQVRFPIELPHYPPDLGAPDYVFVQKHASQVVILAWADPDAGGGVKLSLWTFLTGTAIDKIEPATVQETTVAGRRALWTTGEHMVFMQNGEVTARRLVQGNTLIWEQRNITFRLETMLPLEEAVKVAESVQ